MIYQKDLALVELLLNANNTSNGWQYFLDRLITHFNLNCCNLYMINPKSQGIYFQEWSGKRPSDIQLNDYMMNYFHSDSTHSLMFSGPSGYWLTPNLRPDKTKLESTDAYQKWAIPNNFIYSTGTTLFKNENAICAIHFNRGSEQPAFSQDEENRFTALTPYIKQAMETRLKIANGERSKKLLDKTIDIFRLPVAILNEFSEVISTNNKMKKVLNINNNLILTDNKLNLSNQEIDFDFQFSLANSISISKNKPLDYQPKTSRYQFTINDQTYSVGIISLRESCNEKGNVFVGTLIYLIPEIIIDTINEMQLIATFNLTVREARVCCLLLQNIPVKNIAELENKSEATIREQLQSSYNKCKVSNQLELINLLGSLPS